MSRTITGPLSGLLGVAFLVTSMVPIGAQEPQSAPSSTPQSALPVEDKKDASSLPPPKSSVAPVVKNKKGKQEYTGPNTVVELPPAPMLDEEGKQRQDPDGKLMFNPPVRQQRDKKGHPLFDEQGKPVMQTKDNLGYDENGKKLQPPKEKPPKTVAVSISHGTLTVDGMTGKAALNYEIKDLKYIYFHVPGIGITVVSNDPFPGAVEQKHAFDDKTLTVTVGEHVIQLTSDNRLLGKTPESAFVRVDKNFVVPAKFPVMGYGPIRVAPYAWPGSKSNSEVKSGEVNSAVEAPPLPPDLRPTLLLEPCPAGQMRTPGPSSLPGQTAAPHPCVPIVPGAPAAGANRTAPPAASTHATK